MPMKVACSIQPFFGVFLDTLVAVKKEKRKKHDDGMWHFYKYLYCWRGEKCMGAELHRQLFVHTTLFDLFGMNFSDHMSLRVRGVDLFHKKMEEQSATDWGSPGVRLLVSVRTNEYRIGIQFS